MNPVRKDPTEEKPIQIRVNDPTNFGTTEPKKGKDNTKVTQGAGVDVLLKFADELLFNRSFEKSWVWMDGSNLRLVWVTIHNNIAKYIYRLTSF